MFVFDILLFCVTCFFFVWVLRRISPQRFPVYRSSTFSTAWSVGRFVVSRSVAFLNVRRNNTNCRTWISSGMWCCSTCPQLMYALYALLVNVFALFVFTDHRLNVYTDEFAGDDPLENRRRVFDHVVGKYYCLPRALLWWGLFAFRSRPDSKGYYLRPVVKTGPRPNV